MDNNVKNILSNEEITDTLNAFSNDTLSNEEITAFLQRDSSQNGNGERKDAPSAPEQVQTGGIIVHPKSETDAIISKHKDLIDSLEAFTQQDSCQTLKGEFKDAKPPSKLSIDYILTQMEAIRADNSHILSALEQLGSIQAHAPSMNASDMGSASKAEAMGDVVKARETTNQKILSMLQMMYEDLLK